MGLIDRMVARTGIKPTGNTKKVIFSKGVRATPEFLRVKALPRRVLDLSQVPDLTSHLINPLCKCKGCQLCEKGPPQLWPIQSAILMEAYEEHGALGPIAVGAGKTPISLLLGTVMGAERPVLMVPPQTKPQLLERDLPLWSRHFMVSKNLKVLAYSQLSVERYAHVLEELNPDLIIADEAHNLRHKASTRTKRFLHYMKKHPECAFVALSGTMTTKSLKDYAHLAEHALRGRSPLPISDYNTLEEWSAAIDVPSTASFIPMAPGCLLELCTPAEQALAANKYKARDMARAGFRRRLVESHGVIATSESALGTSLTIAALKPEVPEPVKEALKELYRTWKLGDEELEDPTAVARSARQLACGFYYIWDWPDGKDLEWLETRAAWHQVMRSYLTHHARPGLDSPLLIARAADAFSKGQGTFEYGAAQWAAWAKVKHRPQPDTSPVWISDFLVKEILAWAATKVVEGQNGIIWTEHRAVEDALRAHLPTFGAGSDRQLLSITSKVHPVIVCSIRAHGTGKNLQPWNHNLVTSPPANGTTWEQLLGRTHRPGQEADEVYADVFLHTVDNFQAWEHALEDAKYIEQTHGSKQKILYATKLVNAPIVKRRIRTTPVVSPEVKLKGE